MSQVSPHALLLNRDNLSPTRRQLSTRTHVGNKWSNYRRSDKISCLLTFRSKNKRRKDALKRKRKSNNKRTSKKQSKIKSSKRKERKEKKPSRNFSKTRS